MFDAVAVTMAQHTDGKVLFKSLILLNEMLDAQDLCKPSRRAAKLRKIAKTFGLRIPEWLRLAK